jgi:lipopolysaccharide transport system ATP-binding protein
MSRVAVSVSGVSKRYKLYRWHPYRLLDFLLPMFGNRWQEKECCALQDVSFDVLNGTTVGIIGRNGSGKSTLLRILAGNSFPTTGVVRMDGPVSALLEIGTAFHPDLTGRENIYISGTYLGMTEKEIDRVYPGIVAFSELENCIHQPVRTYSVGMQLRLAFAVCTSITTDILLIDEVLAVGDAYFSRKCFDLLSSLTREGKTVIIASHDLASIQRFCSRVLWIDQGKLVMDGAPLDVLKAYAVSIRSQEEIRLRHEAVLQDPQGLRARGSMFGSGEALITEVTCVNREGSPQKIYSVGEPFTVRIRYKTQRPVSDPVFVAAIYRMDGITVFQAISVRDGVHFGKLDGEGVVNVVVDNPLLGPGQYVLSVGLFPHIDVLDKLGTTPYDLHDRLYEFSIEPLVDCAIDLGLVLQPIRWEHQHGD